MKDIRIMKRTINIIAALCICAIAGAKTVECSGPSVAALYSKVILRIDTDIVASNPFDSREISVDIEFTSPSGVSDTIPCFFRNDATGSWEARFTPQDKGRYVYKAVVRHGSEITESITKTLKVSAGKGNGILHESDNWTFVFDSGRHFRGIGENLCWESRTEDDSKFFSKLHEQHERFNYDVMLPKFAANGGNYTRIWMCSWNFPIDRKSDFNNFRYSDTDQAINESAAARLDHTLELAEKNGIYIMLCMGAGEALTDRDFFVSEEAKAQYRNRLRYIVARWGYSPAIGAFEFFNEIDNIQFKDSANPIPAADIVAWHDEMSTFLKEEDPFGHLVTTSISHRDLNGLNSLENIDFNQKHIYKATSAIPGAIAGYEKKFGKPYVIGEFSYDWDWSNNFDDFADDMDIDFKRGLWYGVFSPTPITPMSWWWEYFDERGMDKYLRAVRTVSDMMLKEGKGEFTQIEVEVKGAEAYAVRCGGRTYVYLFNPGKEDITVQLPSKVLSAYDFDLCKFKPCKIADKLASKSEALYILK